MPEDVWSDANMLALVAMHSGRSYSILVAACKSLWSIFMVTNVGLQLVGSILGVSAALPLLVI